ncbi:MAG: hypothetical protein WCI27_03115, partial [Candidatus Omnitrophota bacterium]
MHLFKSSIAQQISRKVVACLVLVAFVMTTLTGPSGFAHAQSMLALPDPGTRIGLSQPFAPALLTGIKVYPENPFRFDFIMDKGDEKGAEQESSRLIKYFLASLTVPEKDLWVNLSPYEKDRIVPEAFGQTEMGRDLLAQDYLLKQITASVIYPEGEVGKQFWAKVYAQAQARYGSTDIPVDTFNKVWIMPAKAKVYENAKAGTAYVVESRLKVMLDSDYVAAENNVMTRRGEALPRHNTNIPDQLSSDIPKQILREIIIPILEKEVNEGRHFARLRQVYNSLILAAWFKRKVKDSILDKVYVDQKKIAGVNSNDPDAPTAIWSQYVQAFKTGVYNYIKEEPNALTQEMIPRKYFSGGCNMGLPDGAMEVTDRAEGVVDASAESVAVVLDTVDKEVAKKNLLRTNIFSEDEFNKYWPEIVAIGQVSGDHTTEYMLELMYSVRSIRRNIGSPEAMEKYWPGIVELLKVPRQDPVGNYASWQWMSSFKDDLETYWPEILELGKSFGGRNIVRFFEDLNAFKKVYKNDFPKYWPGLLELWRVKYFFADNDLSRLQSCFEGNLLQYWPGFVALKKLEHSTSDPRFGSNFQDELNLLKGKFGEDFEKYWPILVEAGTSLSSGKDMLNLFSGLNATRYLIHNETDLRKFITDLKAIIEITRGVEGYTIREISDSYKLIQKLPNAWSGLIKPIIYRQTVGAFLTLKQVRVLFNEQTVESQADVDFILDFISQEGTKAADILEHFIVPAVKNGIIGKPISQEAKLILNYLSNGGYPIPEVYDVYKNDPEAHQEMIARCRKIHQAIMDGDTTAYEHDGLLPAMRVYVFPPEGTASRELYDRTIAQREDRQTDLDKIPSDLRKTAPINVSIGDYILKDPSKPLDTTPWSIILDVVRDENNQAVHLMSAAEYLLLGN